MSDILKTSTIRIRDPFVLPCAASKTYLLYSVLPDKGEGDPVGVQVYESDDLERWSQPQTIFTLPSERVKWVWAPEIHYYQGRYYLFVTLTFHELLEEEKPCLCEDWPPMYRRGVYVFVGDSPKGPFESLKPTSHTPVKWMALDGTLTVENGIPYMVFCHEWVQTVDGTMECVRLTNDLSGVVGEPQTLFRASAASGIPIKKGVGQITDGCWVHRSAQSGRLYMLWSTILPEKGYCVLVARSTSDCVKGPWVQDGLLTASDGGHPSLFKTFEGRLMMAIHQPNQSPHERALFMEVIEKGERLCLAADGRGAY